jgi:hypothetical protein
VGCVELPHVSLGARCANLLARTSMDRSVLQSTQQIIQLLDSMWISSGISRDVIVIMAAYYAWAGSDPKNSTTKLKQFCVLFNLPNTQTLKKKTAEARQKLIELAKRIPWVDRELCTKNVMVYIPDILKYRRSLVNDTIMAAKRSADDDNNDDDDDDDGSNVTGSNFSGACAEERISYIKTRKRIKIDPDAPVDPDCFVTGEKWHDTEHEELIDDLDLVDADYIRTEAEVKEMEKAMKDIS